ncbi:ATP-binding protein [uncultured Desulfuromusa sp.]|uniref:sensor histidine kinase n=1 Tax=uncultured Desulfuromusa sp. TaxID=219183 RepID=UPI002AA8A53D|nr:ATP-binding protein [uncultured Desulfuromusa sp.]
MKLRTKVMIILVVTVLVAMGGSGLFFFQKFRTAYRNSLFQAIDAVATNNAESLSNYLSQQYVIAQHVGELIPLEAVKLNNSLILTDYFAYHMNDFNFFNNGYFFLDATGVLTFDYPVHSDLYGKDFSFRPYFKQTMMTGKGVICEPYRSDRSGKGVLTITAPIRSKHGELLGIVGSSTRLEDDQILRKIRYRKIGETGYSYVFNTNRLMILHPDGGRMLTRDIPVGANKMFDAAIEGFEGITETTNSRGDRMLVAFRHVSGSNWIAATQLPVKEAFASQEKNQRIFVLFILGSSLFAAVIGAFFVHRGTLDLATLEAVTSDLALPDKQGGAFDIEAQSDKLKPLSNHPEFGALTNTISQLYSKLGRSLAETQQMAEDLDSAYQQLKSTQSQILQQEKMASVGQLAAGVAHEINNPVGFISSNLSTLKRYQEKQSNYLGQLESWLQEVGSSEVLDQHQKLRKEQKISYLLEDIVDLIDESRDGAVRVKDIVQNLKSFSRVDQTKFTQADINDCLESTLAIAMNEIKYKASVEKDFGEIPLISCYPQQLNQVFLNILVNAAQAIEEKGVIGIRTRHEDNLVKITISDNGSGIPESIKEKIFEPFFTTKEVGKGTGLGMSISYDIIKEHKGQIKVDSELGQGTTFTIELPLDLEE